MKDIDMGNLLTRLQNECLFCDPCEQDSQIIAKTDNFFIFVALGQIVEGYLLIVPYKHSRCVAEFSTPELLELEIIKTLIRHVYKEIYNKHTIFFEHGLVTCFLPNQRQHRTLHCYHAHLHCAPADVDLLPYITEYYSPITMETTFQLADKTKFEPYFYYEGSQKYVFVQNKIEHSQFLRNQLARALNCPERADWYACPAFDLVEKTRQSISKWIDENLENLFQDDPNLLEINFSLTQKADSN